MDRAVASAYGWTDLDLGHDYHETRQGVRFTIGELARREVLQRLLKLNHERHEEEEKSKTDTKKPPNSKRSTRAKCSGSQTSIFDKGDDE
jgi:hypothetical protein